MVYYFLHIPRHTHADTHSPSAATSRRIKKIATVDGATFGKAAIGMKTTSSVVTPKGNQTLAMSLVLVKTAGADTRMLFSITLDIMYNQSFLYFMHNQSLSSVLP